MKQQKIALLVLTISFVTFAQSDVPDLEEEGELRLYSVGAVEKVDFRVHHAGHQKWVHGGRLHQNWAAKDCLVLHAGMGFNDPDRRVMEAIVRGIVVTQSAQYLFPLHPGKVYKLEPIKDRRTFVFPFKEIGTYVTGLRIAAKEKGKTLKDVVDEATGGKSNSFVLAYSRGCSLLG